VERATTSTCGHLGRFLACTAHPTKEPTMKRMSLLGLTVLLLAATGTAAAGDRGDRIDQRLDRKGERIEHRLDARGDRIDARLDRKGEHAEARWDRRGDRIDRRLDRRG
jgi:hypothetical protein